MMVSLGKRMARAAGIQLIGNLVRVVLGMAASVMMVRWLGAEEFGKASWMVSLTLYFSVLFSGGIGIPFTRSLTHARLAGDRRGAFSLVGRLWFLRLAVSALVLALCFLTKSMAPQVLGQLPAGDLLLFVPFLLLVSFLHGNLIRVLQVNFRPGLVSFLAAIEIITKVALLRLIGGADPDASALVLAAIGSETIALVGAALASTRILWQMKPAALPSDNHHPMPGISALLVSGRPTWLLSIAQRILGRDVDILLLGLMAGPVEITKYALSYTLATIGLSLASSAFQSTTAVSAFTESSAESSPDARARLLKAMLEYWLVFVTPIGVGGILLGGRFLHFLYGGAADGTNAVVALLFGAFCLGELSSLGKDALHGMGKDNRPARAHWSGGAVNLTFSILLIPHYGALGAAGATLMASIIVAVIQYRFLLTNLNCSPERRSLLASLAALSVLAGSVLIANLLGSGQNDSPMRLSMTVLFAGVAYLLTLGIIGPNTSLRQGCATGPRALRLARRIL